MSLDLFKSIIENPLPFAQRLGLNKLTLPIHREWIRRAFFLGNTPDNTGDETTQAHRNSYKSTCVRVGLDLRIIGKPFENTILLRKTDKDVKDIITAVSKDLQSDISMSLLKDMYGEYPKLVSNSYSEIELSTYCGVMGKQLLGMGLGASITGKHGSVITDDIITLKDRVSAAEREATKSAYYELLNIAADDGQHIQNWGTPWQKDDAFKVMPRAKKHTVYETGILSKESIETLKNSMPASLFAANYELKHIADGDILFPEPQYGAFPIGARALAHIDAAYGGEDRTALTIIAEVDGKLHTIGWMMEGHIENHYNQIVSKLERFQCHSYDCENNADKGFLRKDLSRLTSIAGTGYHESMNKYFKISTYGKARWKDVIYDLEGSSPEYIGEIMDYNENAGDDDAPDSFASLVKRRYYTSEQSFH